MNYKSILFFLGIYSIIVSIFSIINILYSYYFDYILGLNSYLITFIISLSMGLLFFFIGKKNYQNISLNDQIVSILFSFILIPLLITPPYFLSIYNINFLDAYFESMSGITTTGFSILENIDDVDEPLLLWRSSSQWLGGLIFLIAIIGTMGSKKAKIKPIFLVSKESSGSNFYNNFYYNFIKIFLIYFFTTIIIIFLFKFAHLRLLDSVNLALTTVSSGGFINSNDLSNLIINDFQTFILAVTLLFPIFNFYLFFNILTKQFDFKNHQEDLHLLIFITFIFLLFYFLLIPNQNFSNILLAISSSLSTSGIFVNISDQFSETSLFFILITIVGGSLASTSSGFKYVRFYILLKTTHQEIYKLVKPINIFDKNLFNAESKIDGTDLKFAFLVFVSLILSFFILSSILSLDSISFENSFKLAILTLTNTAASSIYGFDNLFFSNLNVFTKLSLIFFMVLGKIEIIAVLYLIKGFIFKE